MKTTHFDLSGLGIFNWFVTSLSTKKGGRSHRYWNCLCDCGNSKEVREDHLLGQKTMSCGCLKPELSRSIATTHGLSHKTPMYATWSHMRQRCRNPRNKDYKTYGGRGITICERWDSFENFYADMSPTWKPGLTIERKDVNGNYCPDNCTWIPNVEQPKNRSNTKNNRL